MFGNNNNSNRATPVTSSSSLYGQINQTSIIQMGPLAPKSLVIIVKVFIRRRLFEGLLFCMFIDE